MTVIRYHRDGSHWDAQKIAGPSWEQVETAIRRMDNYCFPIVSLCPTEDEEAADIFSVCGGDGRWALFRMNGEWQYEENGGGEAEVRLWESDQGYYCREKNILTEIGNVLRITKVFFETRSYLALKSAS